MNFSKIDSNLLLKTKTLNKNEKVNCIVRAKNFGVLKKYLSSKGIDILNEYFFINSFFINVEKVQLQRLSNLANVEYIYSLVNATSLVYLSKKILGVDSFDCYGEGITTAIIDTGVSPHFDFMLGKKRLKYQIDFVNGKQNLYDDNGHGTFVCGVMSGNGVSSIGKYMGIAPKSDIISLKALDKNGEAYSNKILDAMEWVFNNHKRENIRVVCMSFGSEPLGYSDPIMSGAEALWKEGIIVVSAGGNSGPEYQTIKSPCVSPKIITVGGFDDNRISADEYNSQLFEVAEFSSRGPSFNRYKPDVIAPAVDIISCDYKGGYTVMSGTSVATPMIAGMCVLLCEKYPKLSPDEIKRLITSICTPINFNKNMEGFGIPNLNKLNKK